jgi:hypothetical protein
MQDLNEQCLDVLKKNINALSSNLRVSDIDVLIEQLQKVKASRTIDVNVCLECAEFSFRND